MSTSSRDMYRSFSAKRAKGRIDNEIIKSVRERKGMPSLTYIPAQSTRNLTKILKCRSQLSVASKLSPPIYSPERNLSKKLLTKDPNSQDSPCKNRLYRTDRNKQQHIDSLNNLVQKCIKVRSDFYNPNALSGIKNYSDSMGNLKKAIEKCQFEEQHRNDTEPLQSEDILRDDSKMLRQQMCYVENLRKKSKQVWKFQSHAISRRTERLVASIARKLNERNFLMNNYKVV